MRAVSAALASAMLFGACFIIALTIRTSNNDDAFAVSLAAAPAPAELNPIEARVRLVKVQQGASELADKTKADIDTVQHAPGPVGPPGVEGPKGPPG